MRWNGRQTRDAVAARSSRGVKLLALFVVALLPSAPAWSVPAFAREMGVPCAVCHTLAFGPALTPFGRNFKLHGYALGGQKTIPVSADLVASFTHTEQNEPAAPHYSTNNNTALDDIGAYIAGPIAEHVGVFAKVTYDGIDRHTSWGVFDARYAQDFTLGGKNVLFGLSLNNYPTAQDPWNSLYTWGFPVPFARLANGPGATPQIYGFQALQSLGTTIYAMVDNTVYLEAGGYRQLSDRLQGDFGILNAAAEPAIDGTAPYWRATVQKTAGPHYFSAGVVGYAPNVQSPPERSVGADKYTDLGFDATYQFADGGPHTFNANASYIQEKQRLFGTTALGGSSSIANHLNTFTVNGQYAYKQTYSITLAYFDTVGNSNPGLYAPFPWFGSANSSPDSRYYITQLECVPFGKFDSFAKPFLNMRFGLQYTAYTRFNGGSTNYDGFGHSAHDNNTLFLFVWTAI
jgi:hypothetical protein